VEDASEAYEFNWVGKQAARAEVLEPIKKTLRPVKEDSVDWDNTQNLYIEGDNLKVLKLLQKSYLGKVKMIYIDPPYNTGNDFVYHDDFAMSADEYAEASGSVDELGNKYIKNMDSNGRFHSDWCSMIYSRLMVARSLLKEDGVIFISIDDNENYNLRKICDEIFGSSNFIAEIVWERAYAPINMVKHFSKSHDYILCYAKDINKPVCNGLPRPESTNAKYSNPDNDPRGLWRTDNLSVGPVVPSKVYEIITPSGRVCLPPKGRCWLYTKERYEEMVADNRIWFGENGDNVPAPKRFLSEVKQGLTPMTIWKYTDVGHTQDSMRELRDLFDGEKVFDYSKPVKLMKQIVRLYTNSNENDIILDFFSGSASTAHAVLELNAEDNGNRHFMMVQLQEETPLDSEARKNGYMTIPEIGRDRIIRAASKILKEHPEFINQDKGFRVFRLDEGNYEDVKRSPKEFKQDQLDLFLNNIKTDRNDLDLLFGCMLDWGVQLSLPMTQEVVDGKTIYTVNDGDLVACFAENVSEDVVKAMAEKMPLRVIFRDSCFVQDADKINIYETFKQKLDWSDQEVVKNIRVI
jgi:putative modification enzyme of type III restriction-modification system